MIRAPVSAGDGSISQYTIFIYFYLWCFHHQCIDTHHFAERCKSVEFNGNNNKTPPPTTANGIVEKQWIKRTLFMNASNDGCECWQNEPTTIIVSKLGAFSCVRRKNAIRWLANIYEKRTRDNTFRCLLQRISQQQNHRTWVSILSIGCFRFPFVSDF